MLLVNIKAVVLIITAFFDVLYIFMKKSLAKCDCSGYNRIVELTKMCWQGLWYYQYRKNPLCRLRAPAIHNCFFELQRRHNYYITFALFLQGLFCGCVAALWKDFFYTCMGISVPVRVFFVVLAADDQGQGFVS